MAAKPSVITGGFERAGVLPFDPQAPDRSKLLPGSVFEPDTTKDHPTALDGQTSISVEEQTEGQQQVDCDITLNIQQSSQQGSDDQPCHGESQSRDDIKSRSCVESPTDVSLDKISKDKKSIVEHYSCVTPNNVSATPLQKEILSPKDTADLQANLFQDQQSENLSVSLLSRSSSNLQHGKTLNPPHSLHKSPMTLKTLPPNQSLNEKYP